MALEYILYGNMCSGKTTVGQILKNELDYTVVSAKDVIGNNIKNAGESLQNLRKKGYLLPDTIVTEWIFNEVNILLKENRPIVLDGYPRTEYQARDVLKSFGFRGKIMYLDFDFRVIEKRFINRIICDNCGMPFSKLFQDFHKICFNCQGSEFSPRITDKPDYFQVKTSQFTDTSLKVISVFKNNGLEFSGLKDHTSYQELRKDILTLV